MLECFGEAIAMDPLERIMRFLEEGLELVQAEGMTKAEVERVVEYVYGRSIGESFQEVGGVMVTLAAFCFRRGIDLDAAALNEFDRIDSTEMRKRIFEKQSFKRAQGLTSDGGFRSKQRPQGVYGPMCRDPEICTEKGYCPRDPTCAD